MTKKFDWDGDLGRRLGRQSDYSLAREIGAGISTVREARVRRGIPPFTEHCKFDWSTVEFSGKTDKEIAREVGCCESSVFRARSLCDIPSHRETKYRDDAEKAALFARRALRLREKFKIEREVESRMRIVVCGDVIEVRLCRFVPPSGAKKTTLMFAQIANGEMRRIAAEKRRIASEKRRRKSETV